jgi:4-diphosphocytidyl-2C-methyl-D-erythritol kinase
LEAGADAERGIYRDILEILRHSRENRCYAGLSGSGSACFGVYSDPKDAEEAQMELHRAGYAVQNTFFLASKAKPVVE